MNSGSDTPTLYDRLGEVYAIATVVDDFIDRVMKQFSVKREILLLTSCASPPSARPGSSIWLRFRHHGQVRRSGSREERTLCDRAKHEG